MTTSGIGASPLWKAENTKTHIPSIAGYLILELYPNADKPNPNRDQPSTKDTKLNKEKFKTWCSFVFFVDRNFWPKKQAFYW
jgi:hypothetical protein